MTKYRTIYLPKTENIGVLRRQSEQMRRMRLKALDIDQKSFYSQYKDEVDQPEEFWLDRLRGKNAHHWMVVDDSSETEQPNDLSEHGIAFLVVIQSDVNEASLETPAGSDIDRTRTTRYQVGAIWVDPAYRGKGICTSLLEAGLTWMKEQISVAKINRAHVDLGVRVGNDPARQAYHKAGFVMWKSEHLTATNGEEYMMDIMKLELSTDG